MTEKIILHEVVIKQFLKAKKKREVQRLLQS